MPYSKPRRSGRISKQVPITLFGSDAAGRVFTENTHTVVLSLHGAGIVSRHKLLAEQEMTLRTSDSNREVDIRVVGEIGSQGKLFTYGVAFRDEQLDFWQLGFPPPPVDEEAPKPLTLECSGCRAPVTIEHGDYEFDVCTIHGGLVRYCDECAFATVWKFPSAASSAVSTAANAADKSQSSGFTPSRPSHLIDSEDSAIAVLVDPKPQVPKQNAIVLESVADSMSSLPTERRLHCRAKVNYWACVRCEAFGDDIVACFDMSRGGLSFRTSRAYVLHIVVRIAVPFSREFPEAPAIYVPAKVVSLRKIPATEFFRCGVAFFPPNS